MNLCMLLFKIKLQHLIREFLCTYEFLYIIIISHRIFYFNYMDIILQYDNFLLY